MFFCGKIKDCCCWKLRSEIFLFPSNSNCSGIHEFIEEVTQRWIGRGWGWEGSVASKFMRKISMQGDRVTVHTIKAGQIVVPGLAGKWRKWRFTSKDCNECAS